MVGVGIATTGGVSGRVTTDAEEGCTGCWGVLNKVVFVLFAVGPGLNA